MLRFVRELQLLSLGLGIWFVGRLCVKVMTITPYACLHINIILMT
jgi:hypothetical protein